MNDFARELRHRDDGPFGDVLYRYADAHRQRGADGQSLSLTGEDHAHGHAFGQVVDGDGQSQHHGAREARLQALGLRCADVQVGGQLVDEQQERHARQEAYGGGDNAFVRHID